MCGRPRGLKIDGRRLTCAAPSLTCRGKRTLSLFGQKRYAHDTETLQAISEVTRSCFWY